MKNNLLKISITVMALMMFCGLWTTKIFAASENGFVYETDNGGAIITGYEGAVPADLVIPSTLGGNPVTEIGKKAFYNVGKIRSLTIPDSVTIIRESAFEMSTDTKNMGSLKLGNGVTTIEEQAFFYCFFSGELIIPESVTTIGPSAFEECENFTGSLVIPESVTTIEGYAFCDCSGFDGNLTIGNGVTSIGEFAFQDCTGFSGTLTIGQRVESIYFEAFSGCSGFDTIIVPFTDETAMKNNIHWEKDIFKGCTDNFVYKKEYLISFIRSDEGATGEMKDIFTENQKITIPKCEYIAPQGKKFAGWSFSLNGSKIESSQLYISRDTKLYALWSDIEYCTLSFSGGKGASGVAPDPIKVEQKSTYKLPKNPFTKKGYKFVGWSDGSNTYKEGAKYSVPKKDSVTLTAKWKKSDPTKRDLIEQFSERMYTKALGRSAEPDGLKYWADRLEQQVDDGANVAYGFITSKEFKNRKLSDDKFVETMYQTFFDRASDSGGKTFWLNKLKSGASREAVLAGFVVSEEFGKLCSKAGIERGLILEDGTPVNAGIYQFVKRQYTCCLQRDGERDGMDYWATKIAKREVSAVDAAKEFFFSAEFEGKGLSDKQFVERLYETFLGRPFDEIGYAYWNDKMSKGETRREVIDEFATSEEFKGILTSFGL